VVESILSSNLFAWVILPLLIFSARLCDVSMGTIRVIFISRGIRFLAPVIGFFEVIIWLLAIGQVMNNLTNVASYIAYGAGFAGGTLLGMMIEERLSIGLSIVRVITRDHADDLISRLREMGFGVTSIDAEGSTGQVKVFFTVTKRQDVHRIIEIIREYQPHAFYTVEDVRSVSEGVFPRRAAESPYSRALAMFQKGK
jgi:uncharacterized protein YebE (UPF0316 family)